LSCLSVAFWKGGDLDSALRLARQAQQIADEYSGGLDRGLRQIVTGVLIEAGDLAAAEKVCTAALASCRELGDQGNLCGALWHLTVLDLRTGRAGEAAAHLRELFEVATAADLRAVVPASLDCCGRLCAATGRPAEAVTAWAGRRGTRRGAAMSLATATEFALLLAAEPQPPTAAAPAGPEPVRASDEAVPDEAVPEEAVPEEAVPEEAVRLARLSSRERELVTLVARGRTDAQIAAELYITVRTVSSHLDRVRDKTGCRRRADLTRLALRAGLV